MRFLFWLFLILFASYFLGVWGSSIVFTLYLATQLFTALFISRNWIHPGFFYGVSLLLATLANLKIVSIFESGVYLSSYQYAVPELFGQAAFVWALGNYILLETFSLPPRFRLPRLEWNLQGVKSLGLLFWVSVGLIFRDFWLPISLPGALNSILELFPLVTILIYARWSELQQSKVLFLRGLLLTILATGYAVLYAYLRISMIIPGLVFLLGILSAKGSIWVLRSVRFYPLYAFLLIFSVFFITFGAKRGELSSGLERLSELRMAQETAPEFSREARLSAFERSSVIGQLSAVMGLVRDNGHYKGRASAPLLTALIPRFLWPEKPPIALGVWFALEIGAALQRSDGWYNTSINMTIPGQLYLDFGWLGLIFGCWLTGRFLRVLWQTTLYNMRPLNLTGSFFAGYLLYTSFLGLGADLQILVTFLAIYLIILVFDRLLYVLVSRPGPESRQISAPSRILHEGQSIV